MLLLRITAPGALGRALRLQQRAARVPRVHFSATTGAPSPADAPPSSAPAPGDAAATAAADAAAAAAAARVKELQAELDGVRKKLKDVSDDRLYQIAEMENVRRIASTDVRKAREYACQPLSKALLLALDNLDSALRAAAPALPAAEAGAGGAGASALAKSFTDLVEGLRATHRIFVKVLGEHGTQQFGAVGDKFDPHRYDAVSLVPPAAGGPEPGHVAQVLQSGYLFKDRVLRPCQALIVDKP